jgi:hypothetical protein
MRHALGSDLRGAAAWRRAVACAVIVLCATLPLAAQSEAGYRANIGKIAVTPAGGAELGKIVDVALMNGVWKYGVNHAGRITYVPVDRVTAKDPPVPVTPPAPAAPARVEPLLKNTAAEFRRVLALNGGMLEALLLTRHGIAAEWISVRCDAFEPEVLDLLLTIKATQKASPAVTGNRRCGLQVRTFTITGATLDLYRTGAIDDAQVLAAIK